MINGLWTIEFISTLSRGGTGVLVLHDGRLLGGDNGYFYTGRYSFTGDAIDGSIDVVRFNLNVISVFGDADRFSLTFRGNVSEDITIDGIAELEGRTDLRVQIKCKKKEDF